MPRSKRLHFKDINAIKALAFIPVYLFSILFLINSPERGVLYDAVMILKNMVFGSIDLFFFISAFLITSHALREYKYLDKFSFRNFIIRRVFRIAIVLIIALSFAYFVHPWLIEVLDLKMPNLTFPSIEPFLLLVPNYFAEFNGDHLLYILIISSIYMFVQFFIVWGLVLRFFKKQLVLLACALIVIGLIARIIHFFNGSAFFLDTFSYGVMMGFGSLTANIVRNETPIFHKIKELSKRTNTVVYVAGLVLFLGTYILCANTIFIAFTPLLLAPFFCFLIVDQTFGKNSVIQFKNMKILSHMGKLSYGFIVYQGIVGVLIVLGVLSLDYQLNSILIVTVIVIGGFIASLIVSDISFKLFEKPLQRFRREFKKV